MKSSHQPSAISYQQITNSRERGARSGRRTFLNLFFLWFLLSVLCCLFFAALVSAQNQSVIEARLTRFIKQIYNEDDDVRIKFNPITISQNEKTKIGNISFLEMPDATGAGICSLELDQGGGRTRNLHVPFRVFTKRKIFVMRNPGSRGDVIGNTDITVKEIYLSGRKNEYPATIEDVVGRVLKRDIAANTVVTKQVLEEQIALQRGNQVNIVAETKRLLVRTKGKAIDKGRIGDTIRVRNVASGKELMGRVTSSDTVVVQF
ncbi:MAG: flagellar basal body P-ring biosynthesis protein FlgA [Syntrophorhabdus sp. PtaU1.Bin058]|nr:MAG: flagellar basal body P-ring biosynthesis protein FlgA [Syntrophorhabdus sp. PtaU1.Bin058]